MLKIKKIDNQFKIYLILSLILLVFTGVLSIFIPNSFKKYFGQLDPILSLLIVIILGFFFLKIMISKRLYNIYRPIPIKTIGSSTLVAESLAFIMILIDITLIYPENINILLPYSLAFYPIMGFVVDIVFHIIPLITLILISRKIFKKSDSALFEKISFILISVIEPIFQIMVGSPSNFPAWGILYLGMHLFVFNLYQLHLLKRESFISMFVFRLIYYLTWHIIWGYFRLIILF